MSRPPRAASQRRTFRPVRSVRAALATRFGGRSHPVASVPLLFASALLAGGTFVAAVAVADAVAPETAGLAALVAAWTVGVGAAFALPLLAVRTAVAALEARQARGRGTSGE